MSHLAFHAALGNVPSAAFTAAIERALGAPFVPMYAMGAFTVERPMPATPGDIDELRQLIRWSEEHRRMKTHQERVLFDGLKRAISYLEEPDSRHNVVSFLLAALNQSMRRKGDMWITIDRDLHSWAMGQIAEMFVDPESIKK